LRESLNTQISNLNLQNHVLLPGFKQYADLPVYYALADAFIHASTTEQWGLVVNEAMSSGLPVIVSNRCGCALDLVQEGKNGFTFDPYNVGYLAQLMAKISALDFPLSEFGFMSRKIIANWGLERFVKAMQQASQAAVSTPVPKSTLSLQLLLALLTRKQVPYG
jgi:glycosyltransferase involved in cell wall biosynthesis